MTLSTVDPSPVLPAGGTAPNAARRLMREARYAGVLYLAMAILSIFGYMYVPARFMVPGDAVATAQKIVEGAFLYRLSIAASLLGQVLFIFLVLALYELFRDVDRRQARLMVVLVCVGVAAEIVTIANRLAPLVLLGGASFLAPFTQPQLQALAMAFLRWGSNLGQTIVVFWGLWLFPFGFLTMRSGYFPKILGALLLVSGFAYVVTSFASILVPGEMQLVSRLMTPLYFGELVMVIWLPVMGAKLPLQQEHP